MEKSPAHEALSRAYSNPAADMLNPDNHDKVNIALGLFGEESAEKSRRTMSELRMQVDVLTNVLRSTIETKVAELLKSSSENTATVSASIDRLIQSNDEGAQINKQAIFWNKILTATLIGVTLCVGLLQAYVIWKTK